MTRVQFDGPALFANERTRVVGPHMLLPFDEVGATNLGRVAVAADAVPEPDDLSILAVNVEHDQLQPVARFDSTIRTPQGILASFRIGVGKAGDALLAAIAAGTIRALSVELANVVVRDGVVRAADLTGAGFVAKGAFPSALLASEHPDVEAGVELAGDAAGAEVECAACAATLGVVGGSLEHHEDGSHTFVPTPDPVTTDPDPEAAAAAHTTEEPTMPAPTLPASIAATLQPLEAAASTTTATPSPQAVLQAVFAAHAEARRTRSNAPMESLLATAEDASRLFAALKDVKFDAEGTGLSSIMSQPQWLGHLWEARRVRRRIIPLIGSGTLTGMSATGWKWKTRPAMAAWAGNKTAVPSNEVEVEPFDVEAQSFAGAHDIDIRFRHFEVPGFWEGYYQSMTDSYASLTDAKAFADLVAAATDVAPGAVPAGTSKALTYIVDGALSFIDDVLPTYALVSKDLWRELILTPHDNRLAYLDAAFGLEEGSLGQTSFRIQPAPLAADTVVVGVKEAAQWFELGETPIRVEGLDVVKGGIDPALFGYGATVIHDARAIAKVSGTAPGGA